MKRAERISPAASGRVLGPNQRITPIQAFRAHTIDAAWQVFREDDLGSIEPGKSADFAILSKNADDIEVVETIKDGALIQSKTSWSNHRGQS